IVPTAPAGCTTVRGWDLAATRERTGSNPAFTVGVKLSRAPSGVFYIEDVVRLRGSSLEVENAIKNAASVDGTRVRISVPQDPGQAGKAQAEHLVRQLAGYTVKASPESGDKATRAEPVAAQAEAGNVKLVRGPWIDAFLAEAGDFPNRAL